MAKTCRGCGREFAGGETFCPDDGSRLSSPSQARDLSGIDPMIGVTLDGRYRLLRAIGEGGMGVVYEAEHVLIEKRVAVKVLRESFTRRSDVVERFRQEAKSASRIGHPNIVDVSDFGETPSGSSYIVMEMLKGEDLADILSRECALSPLRAAHITYQVARALGAAHQKSIIHRDLKPENIYLIERNDQPDFVKVVDFGVAKMSDIETLGGRKLTRTGMIFGTPEYMSPEHAGGKSLDHRVDIYALGVILYELLTGRVPFEGDNFMEVLAKHGRDPVPDLRSVNPGTRVSSELQRVVFRSLEKDPEKRYQTMDEMAAELRTAPEMPQGLPHESVVPPEWARSAPPAVPLSVSSMSPVESRARTRSTLRARLLDRRVLFGIAGVAAACVIGIAWLLRDDEAAEQVHATALPPKHETIQPEPSAPSIAAPPPQEIGDIAPPSGAAVAPALAEHDDDSVDVQLRTDPAGARVAIDGRGEVCARTPCLFQAPKGEEVTLHVRGGSASVVRTLVFDDSTDLELRLGGTPKAKPASKPQSQATRSASDLKVPALFR